MKNKPKKDIIADAALSCFLASGYGATSVDEIVKASGVSKGGIYWHFKSKEDIFLYLFERWVNQWRHNYLASVNKTHSTADKLTLFTEQRIRNIDTSISALMLEFLLQSKDQETIDKMNMDIDQPTNFIFKIIEEGIAKGEFKSLNPKVLTLCFFAIFDGLSLQFLLHRNKELLEETTRETLNIFLTGVSVP
ncbi:TetR/AcrR family transcriptional regulator [Desulforamulus ruminis]|uniref:Regulatory protein TetR n=1 Tax=Desulforamulus ruminis (strain ATCC 23193 / DSM 2154 / NCIMB 8452 / DL) TaxID=696281 RepID=F6DSS2_DESRL|nr:TetR/AcrR family transcriptional regulator [Desulforamulus ruminis]AEG58891.1 regulatory protein TetR [Desulforamulus ruminis DSM 2154]